MRSPCLAQVPLQKLRHACWMRLTERSMASFSDRALRELVALVVVVVLVTAVVVVVPVTAATAPLVVLVALVVACPVTAVSALNKALKGGALVRTHMPAMAPGK